MSRAAELWRVEVAGIDTYESLAVRLSRSLSAADDATMDAAAASCLEEVCRYAEVDRGFVAVLDEHESVAEQWAWDRSERRPPMPPLGTRLDELSGSVAAFLRIGRTLAVGDLAQLELTHAERAFVGATEETAGAGMMLPVTAGTEVSGLLSLYSTELRDWTRQLVAEMESVAELVVRMLGRNHTRHALAAANARARRIAAHLPDGLLMLTTDGTITWASPSFEAMVGISAGRLEHLALRDLVSVDDGDALYQSLASALAHGDAASSVRIPGRSGEARWADLSLHLASDPDLGVPDEIVVTVRDSHDRRLYEEQLVEDRDRDALTGLANRGAFDRFVRAFADSQTEVTVAFVDVDNFKSVNDQLGHGAGDRVLQDVAAAVASAVRKRDMVARVGGDEFVAVVLDPGPDVTALGERLLHAVRGAAVEGLTVSVGVCGPGPARRLRDMITQADEAMYAAKRSGKDGWVKIPLPS